MVVCFTSSSSTNRLVLASTYETMHTTHDVASVFMAVALVLLQIAHVERGK